MQLKIDVTAGAISQAREEMSLWPHAMVLKQIFWEDLIDEDESRHFDMEVYEDRMEVMKNDDERLVVPFPQEVTEQARRMDQVEEKIQVLREEIRQLQKSITPFSFTLEIDEAFLRL